MPIPNLLHPVPVKIRQLSRSTTVYDDDAREPIQIVGRTSELTVQGQVRWYEQYRQEPTLVGVVEGASGYVLFRLADLEAQSVVLQRQDQFVQIGSRETDVYVVALEWVGHYADQGGPTMVKAHFADRQPARQTRGGV
jgi:hypothetical protein